MIRGKGLTQESIKQAGTQKGGLMNLYKSLYDGEEVKFDLTANQPCFEMKKNFTVSSRDSFIRRIKSTYSEGQRIDYF